VACLLVFGVWQPISLEGVQGVVQALGWAAPAGYVLIAAALACLMVPGNLLAAGAGVLFGPALGTAVALTSATLTAVIALHLGRTMGRDGLREVGGHRVAWLERLLERHGVWAVIVQRLTPGIPDGPSNYAFGAAGVRTWQVALGTAAGALPRAFAYSALGASAASLDGPLAAVGAAVLIVAGVTGTTIAARAAAPEIMRRRRAARARRSAAAGPPAE
jgi:uncharacterized membrane protein YdjX (TVP38/TMEM64 family)